MLNLSSFFISKELINRGYTLTKFYDDDLLLIEKDGRKMYTHASITVQQTTSFLICRDKFLSKQILQLNNIPTAKGVILRHGDIEPVEKLNFPIALKPLTLSGGKGVLVGIKTLDEVADYMQRHQEYEKVLAEEMLVGTDTRILVVKGKFFAACQREPASIVGDGVHSIRELVFIENSQRHKSRVRQSEQNVHDEDIFPILFDSDALAHLGHQGLTEETVLSKGTKCFVRSNANVASGGRSIDVTDQVCEEIRVLSERVSNALRMSTIGVDLISERLDIPINDQLNAGIVEINASPGLSLHTLTHIGQRRNPVPLIVDEIEDFLQLHLK